MTMQIFNDTVGNRTSDLPVCSAMPQPTTQPRTHRQKKNKSKLKSKKLAKKQKLFFLEI
jgi:hypothetical protein